MNRAAANRLRTAVTLWLPSLAAGPSPSSSAFSVAHCGGSLRSKPPNLGLLRTKDRCPFSEFVSVRGPARLVIEQQPDCGPAVELRRTLGRSFAAEP